jgi:hypothetical protein
MAKTKNKLGDRVHNQLYGYGEIIGDGPERVHVRWDDGSEGGAEVKQLITEEEAKKKGL